MKQPLRIAFLSPFLFRYLRGIERFTVELANQLATRGAEIHLITWRGNQSWPWGELKPNITLHALRLPRYFTAFWAGVTYPILLQKLRLDVVNLFFTWHGEELAFRLNPFLKSSVVLNLHYPAEQVPHRYQMLQKSRIPKIAKQIVAVSHYVAEGARKWLGRSPLVIYNGVNLNQFFPATTKIEARKKLNIPNEALVLTTTAALEERKGISKVLAALPKVIQNAPNLIYLVAGDGPEREKLLEQTKIFGLQKHARFLGAVRDLTPLYHATDLFMFLSTGEAFGLALLEAMACGLPIIAAKRPPLEEFASPEGALFVDDTNANHVAQAISELISNPAKRARMGRENRKYVEKDFAWDRVAEKYLELYQSLD